MTFDHYRAARTFRRVMDQPTESTSLVHLDLQAALITEEFQEFMDAHVQESDFHTLKELADLAYVCYQYAACRGWDLDEALDRVHRSNLTKLVDGEPLKNEDGKVLKGPNYRKPYLGDLLQ